MVDRAYSGLMIAALKPVRRHGPVWRVPSDSGDGGYFVRWEGDTDSSTCGCPDYVYRHEPCKHIMAVSFVIQRENSELKEAME